jgi:hypothetical protein
LIDRVVRLLWQDGLILLCDGGDCDDNHNERKMLPTLGEQEVKTKKTIQEAFFYVN